MSKIGLSCLENLCSLNFFHHKELRKSSLNPQSPIRPLRIEIKETENETPLIKQISANSKTSSQGEFFKEPATPMRLEKEKSIVTEKDFRILQVVRTGKNWRTYLVRRENEEATVYAMKLIAKKRMEKNSVADQVTMEREILDKAKHPFIPKLAWSFENDKKIFLVMEFVKGATLLHVLKQLSRFSEEITRFYSAEILLTLEYLHKELQVSYNDVKLRNFLLDPQGHIKLIDYCQSKKLPTSETNNMTTSSIGNKEASQEELNDFWGFGMILYRLLTGKKAFKEDKTEQNDADINSPTSYLSWPCPVSKNAKDLISRLLNPNPDERLGVGGIAEIKNHPFFAQVNWEKMLSKSVYPPLDVSQYANNENEPEEQDEEFEDSPIKASKLCSLDRIVECSSFQSDEDFNAVSFDRRTTASVYGHH